MKKLACAALLLALISTASHALSDVAPGDWFYQDVTTLYAAGIIDGYPDGTFSPQGQVSWAEYYKLLFPCLFGQPDSSGPAADGPWYAGYIALARQHGIFRQVEDWNAPIPKIEAACLLAEAGAAGAASYPAALPRLAETIPDYQDIPAHQRQSALEMAFSGMIIGGTGGSYRPHSALTRAEAATIIARVADPARRRPVEIPALPIDGLKALEGRTQIITVTSSALSDVKATVNAYQLVDGVWLRTHRGLPAVLGTRGMMYNRKQDSRKTPAGQFGLVFAFGAQPDPGVHQGWAYRDITPQSYWVLDSSSPLYNRWTEGKGTFRDYERLQDFGYQYDYAMVIDFNYHSPVKGDGGAIFMHVATKDGKGTAGCIGLGQEDLLALMLWLDPDANPAIIICPEGDLTGF